MKITIDLENKTIILLGEASVNGLLDFLDTLMETYPGDWKISVETPYNPTTYPSIPTTYPPFVPYYTSPYNPPYYVDSSGNYTIDPTYRTVSDVNQHNTGVK